MRYMDDPFDSIQWAPLQLQRVPPPAHLGCDTQVVSTPSATSQIPSTTTVNWQHAPGQIPQGCHGSHRRGCCQLVTDGHRRLEGAFCLFRVLLLIIFCERAPRCLSVACKFPTPWHRQAFQAFLTCLLQGQLPYGPLLGWGWLTGRNFWVPAGADYPCPDAKVGEWHCIAEAGQSQ